MKRFFRRIVCIAVAACVFIGVCGAVVSEEMTNAYDVFMPEKFGCRLKRIVMLSRHGVRAPQAGGIDINELTTHDLSNWSADSHMLTLLGGLAETISGQFFRNILEYYGFIPSDWRPKDGEVRILANDTQRTIASAHYFATGLMPTENVTVEVAEAKPGGIFSEIPTFMSEAYKAQVDKEFLEHTGGIGAEWVYEQLKEEIAILEELLDFQHSEYAQKNGLEHIPTDSLELIIENDSWPDIEGGLQIAAIAADALGLYQLEGEDELGTLFGETLTDEENNAIMSVWDTYASILFSLPSVAVNSAHPMLKELKKELTVPGRMFSYLYGHDANILSVLSALKADAFALTETVGSLKTPVGCKLVFAVWEDSDGKEYISISLINLKALQIRGRRELSIDNLPSIKLITLDGLKANEYGCYRMEDVLKRFDEAIDAYYKLPKDK